MQGDRNKWMSVGLWMVMGIVMSLAFFAVAAPINDDCSEAIELTLDVPYDGSTWDASGGMMSSCSWYDIYDVWYSFTAPKAGPYEVEITNSTFWQTVVLYDSCDGNELVCNGEPWSYPSTFVDLQAGQACLIRVAGYNWDTGDFTISVRSLGPSLNLLSPLGGSQWLVGLPVRIAWDTQAVVETVRLEYSADGGSQWTDIATVPNAGHYEWAGPATAGSQYMIRISDASDPAVSDTMASVFSVVAGTCDQILNYARSRIFEQTVSGIRAAYPALGLVLSRPDCAGSARLREARFLHAVTRLAMLGLADDSAEPTSALEMARLFAVTVVGDSFGEVDFTYPTNNHDYYEIPDGAPNWDQIKQILETTSVAEIDAIVAELNLITETSANRFRLRFTPEETGRSNSLEVDFADVKILKSALKWAKGLILTESAYDQNMTEEDQKLLMEKIYGNALSVNLDMLNKYPNLLKVLPTPGHPENGKTMLAGARNSVVEAIADILSAMTDMESENSPVGSDPQDDELIFIDSSCQDQVNTVRQRMTTLRNSLVNDTVAVFTADDERTYRLTDPSKPGRTWTLDLDGYDPFNVPNEGEFWTDDWDFPSSWTINEVEISNNRFIIEMNMTWGWGSGVLEGTFSADKTRITEASFEYWDTWSGSGILEGLTGVQTEVSISDLKINLNPIFGSSALGKYPNPVSPRNMLPSFTDWNWVLPNTMGAGLGNNATLGGVLPDMTHADWNDAFNARPASEYPAGSIEGTIQFAGWVDEPIYIQAFTDPGEFESTIAETMITQPGAYVLKGLATGQTVYIRAFVPLFGFKIFELGAFEIEAVTKVEMTATRTVGINLTLQRPVVMANGVWYSGDLDNEMAFRYHYSFEARKDQRYCFQLDTTYLEAGTIVLYGRNGQTELVERFPYDTQEIVDWICPVAGQYFVKVSIPEWNHWMGYAGSYQIRMLTPTPDLNRDGCVTVEDLAFVAERWLYGGCELYNEFCDGTDLDHNGQIDMIDFSIFAGVWGTCDLTKIGGLVAYWPMDDNAADTAVVDAGANHFDGAAQRNTAALMAAGKFGTALAFNGTTDWIDCGTNPALLPDAWTVCAWVKCTETATPLLFSFGGNYPSIKLQNNSKGKPMIHLGASNYRSFAASAWTTLKDGQWHHVAFSVPGTELMDVNEALMYLDGVPVDGDAPFTTSQQAAKTHSYIGANPSIAAQRFGGAMDDLMLFDRVLSAEEIQRIASMTPPMGSLQVTIRPQGAIDAGAQWRRVGTATWFNSGQTESGIAIDSYTVEFKSVDGWNTPVNQVITINNNQTTIADGTYTMVMPEGLVAYWRMNDNTANKTVADSGGGNNSGAAQQNTAALTTAGHLNGALAFNGTTDWIDCGTSAALLPDAWTLCAWVKCTNTTTPMLVSFGGNYPSVKLQNNANGKPLIHLGPSNYRYFAASAWTTLKDGQWHHVAFTVPGKGQTDVNGALMYVDGVAAAGEAAIATGPQTNKSHVYLGANPSNTAQRFGGTMDEVMIFNRALSAGEINQIRNMTP